MEGVVVDDLSFDDPDALALARLGSGDVVLTSISPLDAVLTTGRVPLPPQQLIAMYGSVEQAEVRMKEEQAWMCPRPDDAQTKCVHGGGFIAPERTIVIGTNGAQCFALQCTSDDSRHDIVLKIEPGEKAEQDVMAYYAAYEPHNAAVEYKLRLLAEEREAFVRNQRFLLRTIRDPKDGRKLLLDMKKYAAMDIMLRDPLRKIAKRYESYRKSPVEGNFEERPVDDRCSVTMEADVPYAAGPENDNQGVGHSWRLLVFEVASLTKWKDVGIAIQSAIGNTPVCAFNDTQLAMMWLPPQGTELCLQTFNIRATMRPKHVSTHWIEMPGWMRDTHGLLTMHMNNTTGTITIAKGNGILVLGLNSIRVFKVNAQKTTRIVTVAQTHNKDKTLAICTKLGECIMFDMDSEDGTTTAFHVPCIEPIFGMRWMSNGTILLHTIMNVICVLDGGRGAMTVLPLIRPTCIDGHGAIFFASHKSGVVAARRPALQEEKARYFDPPDNGPVPPLLQQHVFDGMRVTARRVVHVNQAGVVQVIKLE